MPIISVVTIFVYFIPLFLSEDGVEREKRRALGRESSVGVKNNSEIRLIPDFVPEK